ncbi:MAG: hypothetical protein WAN36_16350 [Calditrichia bacterium]
MGEGLKYGAIIGGGSGLILGFGVSVLGSFSESAEERPHPLVSTAVITAAAAAQWTLIGASLGAF